MLDHVFVTLGNSTKKGKKKHTDKDWAKSDDNNEEKKDSMNYTGLEWWGYTHTLFAAI